MIRHFDNGARRLVLLCTALNEVGGTARHMAKLYNTLDRGKFHPVIVFSSTDHPRLAAFFAGQGCSPDDVHAVPVVSRDPVGCWRELRRLWAELQPDIIHSFFLHSDILSWATTMFSRHIVRISSVEGKFIWDDVNGVGRFKQGCYAAFNAVIRKGFKKTVTVSQDLRQEVISSGVDPARVTVISVGVACAGEGVMRPRAQGEDLVVGCLSRFSRDKGVDLFVEAVPLVLNEMPRVRFRVAGAGEEERALKARARELGISEAIEFSGWVGDVTAFFNDIDVFVMPSRREGCPQALIEAMMHRKACVVFAAPGVNEIVYHETTALVVPCFDVKGLAAAVVRAAKDPALRTALGARARAFVMEKFTVEREGAAWENLYLGPAA